MELLGAHPMDVKDMPKRIEIVYKDALDNIAFLKKQQWIITGYGIAVFAALFAIAERVKPSVNGRVVLIGLALLAAGYGFMVLIGFYSAMKKFRDRLDWIYRNFFDASEQDGLRLGRIRTHEYAFVGGLSGSLVIGAIVASIAIWNIGSS